MVHTPPVAMRLAERSSEAGAPDEANEWRLLDRIALGSSALSGLVLFLLISRGNWYADDYLNMGLAQDTKLNPSYVSLAIFRHPEPAVRIVNWLLFHTAPMNYPLAAALVCCGVGLATWLLYRVLRMSFRPSPIIALLIVMAGFSGLWVPVTAWWAGGSEISGCVLANMLVLHAVLRCYHGRNRLGWAIAAGAWLLAGLAFYERALLGGLFAAAYLLVVMCRSVSASELWRVFRRAWPAYLSLLVVAVGYLAYYLSHHFVSRQPGYSRGELLRFLWVCWSHTLVPALFGGSLNSGNLGSLSFAAPPFWWRVACQLLLLAAVGYGVRRYGIRSLLGWLVFLPLFLAAQYPIASARLTVHGPGVGQENRYLADLLPLIVLTLASTVLVRASQHDADQVEPEAADVVAGAGGTSRHRYRYRPPGVAVAVGLVVVLAVFLTTALPESRRWTTSPGVSYTNHLHSDVAARERAGPWSLYSTYVPRTVSLPTYGRFSTTARIAELYTGRPVSIDDLSKPMYVADVSGHLVPARFQELASVPDSCSGQARIGPVVPVSRPLPRGNWTLQLDYRTSKPTVLRFAIQDGARVQEATGAFRAFSVSGSGRLTFALRPAEVDALRVDANQPGACLSSVLIGEPVAAD
jgi:hypothetical protein